jgi:hypothetical protein
MLKGMERNTSFTMKRITLQSAPFSFNSQLVTCERKRADVGDEMRGVIIQKIASQIK